MKKNIIFCLLFFILAPFIFALDIPKSVNVVFSGKEYVSLQFINEDTYKELSSVDFDPNDSFEYRTVPFLVTCRVCQRSPVTITISSDLLREFDIDSNQYVNNGDSVTWRNISQRKEWLGKTSFDSSSSNYVLQDEGNESSFYARDYEWQFILEADVTEQTPKKYYQTVITVKVEDNTP